VSFHLLPVGLRYHFACLNPFTRDISIDEAPLGLKFSVHKRDAVGRGIYKHGAHQPVLTEWMIRRFGSAAAPKTFIDIGANVGYFTCVLARLAGPEGAVVAFEPEPNNLRLLQCNIALNGIRNASVEPVALGDADGTASLFIYKNSNQGRHSLVASAGMTQIEVPVRRLDDVLQTQERRFDGIDLIKIDVEGYEPFALAGAPESISKARALALEFSPDLIRKTGLDPAEFLSALCRHFRTISLVSETSVELTSAKACVALNRQIDVILEK
jgi:FkbM family methyltransferase